MSSLWETLKIKYLVNEIKNEKCRIFVGFTEDLMDDFHLKKHLLNGEIIRTHANENYQSIDEIINMTGVGICGVKKIDDDQNIYQIKKLFT